MRRLITHLLDLVLAFILSFDDSVTSSLGLLTCRRYEKKEIEIH